MKPGSRELLSRLVLLGVSLLLALLVGEVLLSSIGFQYRPLDVQAGTGSDERSQAAFENDHFVFDPELIWVPRPGYGVFNRQGFRGSIVDPAKPAGQVRIFTVGDSNTLGWAGSHGANWPGFLARELAGFDRRTVVVNAGVWGYSSFQGLRRLKQCLKYQPDLLLISFGSNDAHNVTRSDSEFAQSHGGAEGMLRRLARWRWGQLWLALRDRLSRPSRIQTQRVPLAEYRENLSAMVAAARAQQARVVLLTRPYVDESKEPDWWKVRGGLYNVATLEVAEAHDVPVIDLYSHFKSSQELFADESHFTDAGHQLAAEIIAGELLAHLD